MKYTVILFILILTNLTFAQTKAHKEKFRQLEPDIWLGIWDKENSAPSIKIDTLSYDDIPRSIDFRGTVVEALKWTDATGENILILTVTGQFTWKDYLEGTTEYSLEDKSELYAYLFQKQPADQYYSRTWRVYDFTKCYGVDWYTGFIPKATTITDLDKDGITEVSLPYVSICRGGIDPGDMKIIMYEGNTKYALRGSTMIICEQADYGGTFTSSQNLKYNKRFTSYLTNLWNRHKCEKGKFY